VEKVRGVYEKGRKASLKDEEFKKILRTFKLLPENNSH
jgi:hypothetical protein